MLYRGLCSEAGWVPGTTEHVSIRYLHIIVVRLTNDHWNEGSDSM